MHDRIGDRVLGRERGEHRGEVLGTPWVHRERGTPATRELGTAMRRRYGGAGPTKMLDKRVGEARFVNEHKDLGSIRAIRRGDWRRPLPYGLVQPFADIAAF